MLTEAFTRGQLLYKAQAEDFDDDFDFYYQFCKGKQTLELFAGYGRLANYLSSKNVNIETVELLSGLSKFINIPENKKHISDVLKFSPQKKYERIIAGYNSFCLLLGDENSKNFFKLISDWLTDDGLASLNYYHQDYWADAVAYDFDCYGEKIKYTPHFDLSNADNGQGFWIDYYDSEENGRTEVKYETKIYQENDILECIDEAGLELVETVREFGSDASEIKEPGWIDYVVRKKN